MVPVNGNLFSRDLLTNIVYDYNLNSELNIKGIRFPFSFLEQEMRIAGVSDLHLEQYIHIKDFGLPDSLLSNESKSDVLVLALSLIHI